MFNFWKKCFPCECNNFQQSYASRRHFCFYNSDMWIQFNLMFICNFNIFIWIFNLMMTFSIFIVIFMLNFFVFWNKWISSYFFDEKMMPCRLTHYAQTACIRLSVIQFFSVDQSKINKLTSFTKFIIMIFIFYLFNNFNKPALKNKYKMKNINEFYNKPMRTLWYLVVCCANNKMMRLFFTNDTVHLIIHSNTFFFRRLCNNHSWLIVEKTQATFMFNNFAILSFFVF